MYLSQAWALVYFLHNRPEQFPTLKQGLSHYVALVEDGGTPVESFELAFQIDVSDLENTIVQYMANECCVFGNIPLKDLIPEFTPKISKMSPTRVAYVLGRAAKMATKYDVAAP